MTDQNNYCGDINNKCILNTSPNVCEYCRYSHCKNMNNICIPLFNNCMNKLGLCASLNLGECVSCESSRCLIK